jgi:GTP-binding protein Era
MNPTKAGYCAIIGRPNSGKSTLLNEIAGTKLSIVTPKAQTTRKRVLGIYSSETTQVVFFDTPGILEPKYEMQSKMMQYVSDSISDADIITLLIDIEKYRTPESYFRGAQFKNLHKLNKPIIVVINKTDLVHDKKDLLPIIAEITEYFNPKAVIPISALRKDNINGYISFLEELMPESDFLYDPEMLSTQPERFFVSELIRETVFMQFRDEVPYSTEISIIEFKERAVGKWYISADIIVERDSQKAIMIGKQGQKIKKLGERARKEIEAHLEMEIFLELFVKVRKNWRDSTTFLKSFGY